jgi:FlaA1/EpsC-like NDP-sugar epimerase
MKLVITGGSGSLGKAILHSQEFLESHGISRIRVISRDEQKQVAITRAYTGKIPIDCYLGDVSDRERMMFALKDAHFVIHAAAQKHIDKFELDVPTGYKTNIFGTESVARGFLESKNAVSGMFISTDKSALPITTYGVSKLAAQHLWLWHNTFQKAIRYGVAVYGNIFGSRGSVIETWTEMAKKGDSIPITDVTCTRFFMLIPDAAHFVLRSLFRNERKVHIPEMKSSEMLTLAQVIWEHHNKSKFKYHVTGMRSIEKVHEILEPYGKSSFETERFSKKELKEMYAVWLSKRNI